MTCGAVFETELTKTKLDDALHWLAGPVPLGTAILHRLLAVPHLFAVYYFAQTNSFLFSVFT